MENDWNKVLVDFLKQNQYEVIRPIDTDNPFRLSNPDIAEYALRNGGVCVFSNATVKVYEQSEKLIIKSLSDLAEVNKVCLVRVLNPILASYPKSKSQTGLIKKMYKGLTPKKIQKIISKVRKYLKCKK